MASIGSQLVNAIEGLVHLSAEGAADAIAVFVTALASVRTVAQGVANAAMQGTINEVNAKYKAVPIAVPDLADMVERNLMSSSSAEAEAALSGVDASRFAQLVLNTGEPYGAVDALRLWRQANGVTAPDPNADYASAVTAAMDLGITADRLKQVVLYSRIRDEFLPDLKQLAYSTMSAADTIEARLKTVIADDVARKLFIQAGGISEQYDLLLEAAGDAMGVEAALNLWNHKKLTESQVDTVIARSRINPVFTDQVKLLRNKWLSPYQISQALKEGDATAAEATQWMLEDGYPADQVAAFVTANTGTGTAKHKAVTEAIILTDWEGGFFTQAEATTQLVALGYPAADVPWILATHQARSEQAQRNAAVSAVRTAYLDGHITEPQVLAQLASLQIPENASAAYIAAWKVEKAVRIKTLSEAQVGKLLKDGALTEAQAQARWVAMGFAESDIPLLFVLYPPLTNPNAPPAGTKGPAETGQ